MADDEELGGGSSNQAPVIYLKKRLNSTDDDRRIDSVPLDDTEAISNSTFRCLIEDATKAGQCMIIARM